ncbi:MAG TPA: UDP-2,4-diacetamido-2,4,6-trideoxy-beta-L-altropyranose hydrolase [Candidatus Omnitrophota bacterium]|nr:UDP-2,4-diacetamido-2,4,6-trideoxy-beta-L-altropyranose hydrolase [Candidatus Omnitrophota bacterium]
MHNAHHLPLFFRVDAGLQMGTGHLMRCLALAQAWHALGGKTFFITKRIAPALRRHLRTAGVSGICEIAAARNDARKTIRFIQANTKGRNPWMVVDGYHFGANYLKQLRSAGMRLLVIDDHAKMPITYADLLLNQNAYASKKLYSFKKLKRPPQFLLGGKYCLLRREFWKRGKNPENQDAAEKVLVTMGGADPYGATIKILKMLAAAGDHRLKLTVIVGANNPRVSLIRHFAQCSKLSIRVVKNVKNMTRWYRWADLAITGGGTTCWELAWAGVPMMTVTLADNQLMITRCLHRGGFAISLGWHDLLDQKKFNRALNQLRSDGLRRRRMRQALQKIIDGQGALRTARAIMTRAKTITGA